MTGRRRNPIKTLFKTETLTPLSVVIIRQGSAMDRPEYRTLLANNLAKRGLNQVILLRLESLDDFHILNEPEMNRLGWFRKETEHESENGSGAQPAQYGSVPTGIVPPAVEPDLPR